MPLTRKTYSGYGVEAVAECPYHLRHRVADVGCACGFYAMRPGQPLDGFAVGERPSAELVVELSGQVIECENGYRAEHQRVMSATITGLRCMAAQAQQCVNVDDSLTTFGGYTYADSRAETCPMPAIGLFGVGKSPYAATLCGYHAFKYGDPAYDATTCLAGMDELSGYYGTEVVLT